MQGCIAVLNAGSSSIKFGLYEIGCTDRALFGGQVEALGNAPKLRVTTSDGTVAAEQTWEKQIGHAEATRAIVKTTRELLNGEAILAVGHRVVHGGTDYASPVLVDATVIERLASLIPLAPLHQPHNLEPIRAIAEHAPQIVQVACFDTAFHRVQSELAQSFALPRDLTEAGVKRYGFHGLSYEYICSRLPQIAPDLASRRVIIAHLGNGASLCAVEAGRSVANTMGFTALDGLMMGTRCGSIDPGVVLYLMASRGMDVRAVEDLLYRKSGLLGVSGISSDMRTLRASRAPAAAEAIQLFVYRIVREIGSLAAALGGVDGLVFTAGIGEHDAATRAEVVAGCAWLGTRIDPAQNKAGAGKVSADGSSIPVWVIPTDEERMIADHTASLLEPRAA